MTSCRNDKGTHKAINKFRSYFYQVSRNNTKTCWVLKCDIKKFFANIDHNILIRILKEYIPDENILWLLKEVIGSFSTSLPASPARLAAKRAGGQPSSYKGEGGASIGLPLGNLTSQLFVNVYMNKFDQLVKHKLKARYFIRYADDFVIMSDNKRILEDIIEPIGKFLYNDLKLKLHPDKVSIKTFSSGVDFLGTVNFSDHRILRTKTKRRMFKKISLKQKILQEDLISQMSFNQSLQSYLGMLKHCNSHKLKQRIENNFNSRCG